MTAILIVDDDPSVLSLMKILLGDYGYETITAESGHSALKILETFVPDICIFDIMMPGVNGVELYSRVRANRYTKHTPVIFNTAYVGLTDTVRNLPDHGTRILVKPVVPSMLVNTIQDLLESDEGSQAYDSEKTHQQG